MHDNTLTTDNRDKFIYVAGRYNRLVKFYNVEILCADKLVEIIRMVPSVVNSRVSVGAFFRLLMPQLKPGVDFVNGMEFLSEAQGVPLNSYELIKAM